MKMIHLTAPVFNDRPELIAPFAAMCADLRAGIDGGKFARAAVHFDNDGEPIDLSGRHPDADMHDNDFALFGPAGQGWDGFDFDAERAPIFDLIDDPWNDADSDAHDSYGYDPAYDD